MFCERRCVIWLLHVLVGTVFFFPCGLSFVSFFECARHHAGRSAVSIGRCFLVGAVVAQRTSAKGEKEGWRALVGQ